MRSTFVCLFLVVGLSISAALAQNSAPKSDSSTESQQRSEEATVRTLSELKFHQSHDLTCLASAGETGNSKQGPSVSLVKFDPGCIIPSHWHTPNENVMVLDGTLQQEWRDRETALAKRGDFIHIPSRQINRVKCISETPCMVYLYSDAAWDMHFVDSAGKEISVEEAVAADTRVMEGKNPVGTTSSEAELRAVMAERPGPSSGARHSVDNRSKPLSHRIHHVLV